MPNNNFPQHNFKREPYHLSEGYRTMRKRIEKETDTSLLRRQLAGTEDEIISIAKPYNGDLYWDIEQKKTITNLLTNRKLILNRMFELHCTETEVRRFEKVNTTLLDIMNRFYAEHHQLRKQLDMLPNMAEPNVGKLALFSELYYLYDYDNPQFFKMEEDEFYSSHWSEMIWAISCVNDMGLHSWQDYEKNFYDDGQTWAEGPLDIPPLRHICVCYLAHVLCLHFLYSVPDVLRMTTYNCERFMVDWAEAKIEGK